MSLYRIGGCLLQPYLLSVSVLGQNFELTVIKVDKLKCSGNYTIIDISRDQNVRVLYHIKFNFTSKPKNREIARLGKGDITVHIGKVIYQDLRVKRTCQIGKYLGNSDDTRCTLISTKKEFSNVIVEYTYKFKYPPAQKDYSHCRFGVG